MRAFFLWIGIASSIFSSPLETPKNVILVIGDGMGLEQIKLGRIFNGNTPLTFEQFTHQSVVSTHNAQGELTDSAAAATAIATGYKVSNKVISRNIPGDKKDLKTLLERFKQLGKSTGLVTNTLVTDATPAAFGAHADGRKQTESILDYYFHQNTPNVVFGASEPAYAQKAAEGSYVYQIATSTFDLKAIQDNIQKGFLKCNDRGCPHIYGDFGMHELAPGLLPRLTAMPLEIAGGYFESQNIPHLSDMASAAIEILNENPKGFFLMIESGLIDWIGHKNRAFSVAQGQDSAAHAMGAEMLELDKTMQVIISFLNKHPDTLVVLTADHETGGLLVKEADCLGKNACIPTVEWRSSRYDEYEEDFAKHTPVDVGVFARGKNSDLFSMPMDNTEFVSKIFSLSDLEKTNP